MYGPIFVSPSRLKESLGTGKFRIIYHDLQSITLFKNLRREISNYLS